MKIWVLFAVAPAIERGNMGATETDSFCVLFKFCYRDAFKRRSSTNILKYGSLFFVFQEVLLNRLRRKQMAKNINWLSHCSDS